MPGTYTVTNPLSVPAFGISLEAYWSVGAVATGRGLIEVDRLVGAQATAAGIKANQLPPSVIRGLMVDGTGSNGNTAVLINPGQNLAGLGDQKTVSVGVHQCDFRNIERGIWSFGDPSFLELNEFIDNDIRGFGTNVGAGIDMLALSESSCLLRSNRIAQFFFGVRSINSNEFNAPGVVHPRILSNFIDTCQNGVEIAGASARIVNNTIAFITGGPSWTTPASINYTAEDRAPRSPAQRQGRTRAGLLGSRRSVVVGRRTHLHDRAELSEPRDLRHAPGVQALNVVETQSIDHREDGRSRRERRPRRRRPGPADRRAAPLAHVLTCLRVAPRMGSKVSRISALPSRGREPRT